MTSIAGHRSTWVNRSGDLLVELDVKPTLILFFSLHQKRILNSCHENLPFLNVLARLFWEKKS